MIATMSVLRQQATQFAEYLDEFLDSLEPIPLEELLKEATGPENFALVSVDMINGFCYEGTLCSDRVQKLIKPICLLMDKLHDMGVANFILNQDTHSLDTPEFKAYPMHCLKGTSESETVPEFGETSASEHFKVFPKNSLSSFINSDFANWVETHPEVTHYVIVGDCTDLCAYHLAMHLRMQANALNLPDRQVIVPVNCVQTYDLPLEIAKEAGALPHPGDLLHAVFLYHMALNGIRLVREIN